MWKNRQELKVEDAGIAALFGLECFAWFCAGEIVGRGFTFTVLRRESEHRALGESTVPQLECNPGAEALNQKHEPTRLICQCQFEVPVMVATLKDLC
ncbi:hypothetical protein F8388_001959 [Cannabis sativa]|uniref:Uncharacterized protein n=1 Tax=Cannabis sativa TaxID=3483 RepID=A0A7J6FL50_CANSA|nr:hypothetical protein F8388_001959 [Cannabis sativa]